MIKKIIFIVECLFSARDYERFGIDLLIKNGFKVEILDLSIYMRLKSQLSIPSVSPVKFSGHIVVQNKSDLNLILKDNCNQCFIITVLSYRPEIYFIYKYISKYNIPYGLLALAAPYGMPRFRRKVNISEKIINGLVSLNSNGLKYNLKKYVSGKLLGIKPAKYVFAGGAECSYAHKLSGKRTQVIWIHTFDYDIYLAGQYKKIKKDNYAVFLDQNLPFHPDFITEGILNPIDASAYYSELANAFDAIEKKFGLTIVIAAHPSANKKTISDYFRGRNVFFGNTSGLVQSSDLCITHWSYSINFAVLFKKPIILLTSASIKKLNRNYLTDSYSSELGISPVNTSDGIINLRGQSRSVSHNHYQSYTHRYIKKINTPERQFWDVVATTIKKVNVNGS